MDACHHGLFFITGALIGAGFTAYVCWQFLLRASTQSGRKLGYETGWADAYKANAGKISVSMCRWQWPSEDVSDAPPH